MIVLPDADVDMAADAAVSAGYGSAGERCMAVSVLVAVGDVADPLVAAIKERLPKVKVGNGLEPDSEMGPLVTREHRDKVASYIESGSEQGATVVADGRETAPDGDGFFLGVSLLDNVTTEMDAYRDEIFGPVLSVVRAETLRRGASGSSTTTRTATASRSSRATAASRASSSSTSTAGMVGINVPIPVPVAYYSFGGWKASLFGDSHAYGPGVDPLLHAGQGGDVALARSGDEQGRPRVPADALSRRRTTRGRTVDRPRPPTCRIGICRPGRTCGAAPAASRHEADPRRGVRPRRRRARADARARGPSRDARRAGRRVAAGARAPAVRRRGAGAREPRHRARAPRRGIPRRLDAGGRAARRPPPRAAAAVVRCLGRPRARAVAGADDRRHRDRREDHDRRVPRLPPADRRVDRPHGHDGPRGEPVADGRAPAAARRTASC